MATSASGRKVRPATAPASRSARRRPGARRSACRSSIRSSFLGQASTESQGPWDSNYQIEDDFSWFLPGKKGDHDLKFGVRYNYTELERVSQINENGTFRFNTDLPFDAANPRTYPERLTIRTGTFNEFIKNHTYEGFAQDKWRIGQNTTLSIGLRYDLEIIPLDEADNPLFPASDKNYPVDKNNFSPRVGFSHSLDDAGKMVVRAGYGRFYNRTILGAIDDTMEFGKYTTSNVVQFPNNAADPGPGSGQFPTNPFLVNGPVVNRALLEQLYPPGVAVKNNGVVVFDSPDRQVPYADQFTAGFARQLGASMAVNVDYIRMMNRDMFLARNLNPAVRVDTSRTGALVRVDAFGVLDEQDTTAGLGHGEHGRVGLRRPEPVAREALLEQLVRTVSRIRSRSHAARRKTRPTATPINS